VKWILVILTVAGGTDTPQRTLDACLQRLHHTRVSPMRQAFCMSREEDVVFFARGGKRIAVIR
jgi:hypothetical protein